MIKYVNSAGKEFILDNFPVQIKETNFHSYKWSCVGDARRYGINVNHFSKDPLEYEIKLWIKGSENKKKEILNTLYELTEYDVVTRKTGKLIYGDYYLECFIISSKTAPAELMAAEKIMYAFAPYPFWFEEETFRFPAVGTTETAADSGVNYLKYPYDYPYDYAPDSAISYLKNDSISPSDFKITIYGPCTNPTVYYSENICELSTMLREGEYITVDSRDKKIFKHFLDGTKENIVNSRNKKYRVFEPIRPGTSIINRNSSFGVDITIFKKRSEPKWSLL